MVPALLDTTFKMKILKFVMFVSLQIILTAPYILCEATSFKQHPDPLDFHKAQETCNSYGSGWTLADASKELQTFMNQSGISHAWLPVRKHSFDDWLWVNGTKGTIQAKVGEFCAGVTIQKRSLDSMFCSESGNGFVCEMSGSTCPLNEFRQICFTVDEKTFFLGCFTTSWFQARSFCASHGGDLAILDSHKKQQAVLNHIIDKKHIGICDWIYAGLRLEDWLVVPDSKVPLNARWASNHPRPDQSCAQVDHQGVWKSFPCNQPNTLICGKRTQAQRKYVNEELNTEAASNSPASGQWKMATIITSLIAVILVIIVAGLITWILYKRVVERDKAKTLQLNIDTSAPNVVMFSSSPIPGKREQLKIKNVQYDNRKAPDMNKLTLTALGILRESYGKVSKKDALTVVNIHSSYFTEPALNTNTNTRMTAEYLPAGDIGQILQILLNHSAKIDVVLLPKFDKDVSKKENIKEVITKLWELRKHVILVTEATPDSSLVANEVIAVNTDALQFAQPSGNVDFAVVDTMNSETNEYGAIYASGLAAAMWPKYKEHFTTGSKTAIMRHVFLKMIKRERALFRGFGLLECGADKPLVPPPVADINAEIGSFVHMPNIRRPGTQDKNRSPTHEPSGSAPPGALPSKIKIALLRPNPMHDYGDLVTDGWKYTLKTEDPELHVATLYRDEELYTITKTLLYLKPDNMKAEVLKENVEFLWFTVCDKPLSIDELAFNRYKDEILQCHVIYYTNLFETPKEQTQREFLKMSSESVVVTLATNIKSKGMLPVEFPGDRVITVGRKFNTTLDMLEEEEKEEESANPEDMEMVKLIKDVHKYQSEYQSCGSTLDFLCDFEIGKDDKDAKSANFQAVAAAAMLLLKAKLMNGQKGIDSGTFKRICTTPVMHSIMRHMSAHPESHTMEEGWGELDLKQWVADDEAFSELIKHYGSPTYQNRFWIGKNII